MVVGPRPDLVNRGPVPSDRQGVVELTDDALLAAVAAGDAAALARLYDRHAGWLLVRLRRRCSDHDVVEEVLQEIRDLSIAGTV